MDYTQSHTLSGNQSLNFNSPRVSCIIVFFNAEAFIREAIESILSQEYENWELLLVDDGSTDKSTEIALGYVHRYPSKIHYFEHSEHRNCGIGASRNLGLDNAKGEFIAFLDADDVWLPNKLERQLAICRSFPKADLVYGRPLYWFSWSGNPDDIDRDFTFITGVPLNMLFMPPQFFIHIFQTRAQRLLASDAMFRRSVLRDVGRYEMPARNFPQDRAFFVKIFLKAAVYAADEVWLKYRRHADSYYTSLSDEGLIRIRTINYLKWLEQYLIEEGLKDSNVWEAFKKYGAIHRHPVFSRLNSIPFLAVQLGRRLIVPAKLRHWLWQNFGKGIFEKVVRW